MNELASINNSPCMGADTTEPIEPNVNQALTIKRRDLMKKLEELETIMGQINEEYTAKVNELQARKKPLEEALFHIEALLKLDGRNINGDMSIKEQESAIAKRGNTAITEVAFALLQEEHKPLHYKEITKLLQAKNVYIPGKNPAATLLSRISRDKRFKRDTKRGVYILSGWRVRNSSKSEKKTKPGNTGKRVRNVRGRK